MHRKLTLGQDSAQINSICPTPLTTVTSQPVSLASAVADGLKKWATFSGRTGRYDYFAFLLFGLILSNATELLLDDGLSPHAQWFDGLAPDIAAKVATAKYRMQQGNLSSVEWFRGIGEYKINYGAGWRIYLAKDGVEIIMLLGGGSKNGQQRDIDQAVELWKEYKRAKANLLKKTKSIVATSKRKG